MSSVTSIDEQYQFYLDVLQSCSPDSLLDAGCGSGRALDVAAARLPGVRLTGIDNRPSPLAGLPERGIAVAVADVRWLPFRGATFASVFCRDVLECIPEPRAALADLTRVSASGGVLLVCHWDWDTQVFNVADVEFGRRLVHAFADTQQGWMEYFDPVMGRRLHGIVAGQPGLQLIDHGVVVLAEDEWREGRFGFGQSQGMATLLLQRGKITRQEKERWLVLLEEAAARDEYLYSINHYWCLARKK